jgi:hypothetical protein
VSSHLTAARASAWYLVGTLATTWPLALGLTRDIPWDLGDSVLNAWILQWGADHALAFLGGRLSAFSGYWSPGIFYPEPLALAYSEHLTAQVVQILPVYAMTGSIILSYNLLFMSTFVLSGLGMFLLVRELTGSARAAFVAGMIYAFSPLRIGQFSHLQVLSAQWMPFVLYGLRRYVDTQRIAPLAGATVALVAQNLSCGYYLLYFPPFAAVYLLVEVARRRRWRDRRMWTRIGLSAAVVSVVTVAFLLPYAAVRARGFEPRALRDIVRFSADVYSYLTTHGSQWLWGRILQIYPKPEGELFPGAVALLLAAVGVLASAARLRAATRSAAGSSHAPRWRRVIVGVLTGVLAVQAAALLAVIATGGVSYRFALLAIRATSVGRPLLVGLAAIIALAWLSPRVRVAARQACQSPIAFALLALVCAWALSLGPRPESLGRHLADWGPYAWLNDYVPGFDGLRVPARYGVLVTLFLAMLSGYGVRAIERARNVGALALVVVSMVVLAESTSAPIAINGVSPLATVRTPSGPLLTGERTPPVYRAVSALPADAVLVEFPFGIEDYELRYMLASAVHRRPLLNGYSGGNPLSYTQNRAVFERILANPDRAWAGLRTAGVTHVIVHEGVFLADEGPRVSAWLSQQGASLIGSFGDDKLFRVGGGIL